jgi:uncharacterized membrane protein YfcA
MTVFAGIVALAVVAGVFGSMLGVGGGVIMVPVLSIGFGLPIKTAIATSMVCVVATSAMAQLSFVKRGMTNQRLGFLLEVASAAGAVLGGLAAVLVDDRVLQGAFAVVLLYVVWQMNRGGAAVVVERGGPLGAAFYDPTEGREVSYGVRRTRLGFVLSIGAGNVAGLLGVGGGVFKVPIMSVLMGVPLKAAIATSNLMIGVTAATGAAIFYGRGYVDPSYAAPAALGILIGASFGPRLAARLPARVLSIIFQIVLAGFAVLMVVKAAGGGMP